MQDLTTLNDSELDGLRIATITEQERRAKLDSIPAAIQALAAQYVDAGGAQADLPHLGGEPEPAPEPEPDEDAPGV